MRTIKVITIADGKRVEEDVECSPEMEKALDAMKEWDGWCRCDKPETGRIEPRGHSVDVFCVCGGCLQIG